MKAIIYILAAAMCLIPASEAGAQLRRQNVVKPSGPVITREVQVRRFTAINSRGFVNVEYRQSGQTKVEVRGNENLVGLVEIETKGGVLEISWPSNTNVRGEYVLRVIVTSPQIAKISTYGSGDINISGPLESNKLDITAYGSGDIRMSGPVESDKLEIALHGSGDMQFNSFKSDELRMSLRGSGDIEGRTVDASIVEVSVFGSGDVDISRIIAETVKATLSGSGDIEAEGRVKNAAYTLRGSGGIDADGLRAENVNATLSGSGDISCHASSSVRAAASGSGSIIVSGNPPAVEIKGNKKSVRFR